MHNTLTRSLILMLLSSFIALASALTDPPSQEARAHSHEEKPKTHNHAEDAGQSMPGMQDRPTRAHDMAMTADSEMSFITQMIPHHQEAVSSARALLTIAVRPELRYFAKTIIQVQQREIETLESWQEEWDPEAPRAAYMPMMPALQGLNPEEAERAFLEGMVGHHQGALEMAASYLEGTFEKHAEVRRLAQGIITAQKGEITQMQAWLALWFPSPQAADHKTHDMSMTVDSEASFISEMIPHHQEAVSSSRALLELTERPELRYFAKTIMQVQQREIQLLSSWQRAWYPSAPEADYMPMMPPLSGSTAEAERAFLAGMVSHHQGALEMAASYLDGNFEKHDEVTRLARAIVVAQKGEIAQMQAWLGAWFGDKKTAEQHMTPNVAAPASEEHGAHSH